MQNVLSHTCTCCKRCACQKIQDPLGAIIKGKPEITYNNNRFHPNGAKAPDGIEIRFGATRPTAEVREMLKTHGFKFSEKQTIWYAKDTPKARELATYLEANEVDIDDTQYEKKNFWAKVRSIEFYNKLSNYTEFMIKGEPPRFFWNKKQLENSVGNPMTLIYADTLRFKKFWNKVVGEEGEDPEDGEDREEREEEESEGSEEQEERPATKPSRENEALAEKFEALADGMQKAINSKLNSATSQQKPTAKRLRVAEGMRHDGYYLRNIQLFLYALADGYRNNAIKQHNYLQDIRTKNQIELLNKYNDVHGRKEEDMYLQSAFERNKEAFKKLGINSVFQWANAIAQRDDLQRQFSRGNVPQHNEKTEQIKKLEREIWSMKIPGFFPTPPDLIQDLIQWANIQPGDEVLEPSAGKGDILIELELKYGDTIDLFAFEINSKLREILKLKGFPNVNPDFLAASRTFDKIVMNPPFENGQDAQHVMHAFNLLKPGGRVTAIMGEGVFFRQSDKDSAFRDFLSEKNAYVSEPIKGAFKDGFKSTGVNVRMVVINEDGSYPEIVDEEEEDEETKTTKDMDDFDVLEAEAAAQVELLKLKLEIEKKRKGLQGIPQGTAAERYNNIRQKVLEIDLPAVWDFK